MCLGDKLKFCLLFLCCFYVADVMAYTLVVPKNVMKTCALASYLRMSFKDCCFKYATKQGKPDENSGIDVDDAPALGEEELEKQACEYWRGTWSNENKTCEDKDGGGGRSMAIWDKTEKKYRCFNAIEYREKLVSEGKKTREQVADMIEYWRPFIYDTNGLLKLGFQDLQWIIVPYDTSIGKCASIDERQCYNKNGRYDWTEYKCYTHDNDKLVCEENGAKFRQENGVSYCDCQLPSMEFHWDSGGGCRYKKGNTTQTFSSGYSQFFMYCLTKHLKNTPVFNGEIVYKNCQ